jgi:hypothetical protein
MSTNMEITVTERISGISCVNMHKINCFCIIYKLKVDFC